MTFGVRYDSVCPDKYRQCFHGSLDCSQALERISGKHGSVGLSPPRRSPSERGLRARLCTALNRVTRRSRWVFTPGCSRHCASRTISPRLPSTICLDENCRMPVLVRTGERPGALALPNPHPCKMQGRSPKNPGNCHDAEASRSCHGPCRPDRRRRSSDICPETARSLEASDGSFKCLSTDSVACFNKLRVVPVTRKLRYLFRFPIANRLVQI